MPTKPPSLQYRLEYAGFRLLGLILGTLPLETASKLGGVLLAWLGPKSRKRQPRLLRNLAAAYPEMSEQERAKLAVEVWRNLGYVVGEFFHIDEIIRERVEVENPDVFRRIAASGKGAVLCGAHQANWEGGSAVVQQFGLRLIGVYRAMSNPFVDADVMRRRIKYYPGGLMGKHDPETPVAMIRSARSGGIAGLSGRSADLYGPENSVFWPTVRDHAVSRHGGAAVQYSLRADYRPAPARRAFQGARHRDRHAAHGRPQRRCFCRHRRHAGGAGKIDPPPSRAMDVDARQVVLRGRHTIPSP